MHALSERLGLKVDQDFAVVYLDNLKDVQPK